MNGRCQLFFNRSTDVPIPQLTNPPFLAFPIGSPPPKIKGEARCPALSQKLFPRDPFSLYIAPSLSTFHLNIPVAITFHFILKPLHLWNQ